MESDKKYYAFISYKREDEKWAKWLQHKLEHYKLPSNLNGRTDLPKEIRPIFRDQSELAGGVLADEIDKALTNSKYLIVICSPRAAQSQWVGKEVQTFIDLGRTDKIIPVIIGGTTYAQNPEDECFPSALLNLPPEQELLGINIDEMGRDAAAVKVVAQMFGVKFDALWQRYEREQRRRRFFIIAAALLLALVGVGVAVGFSRQNKRITEQNEQITKQNEEIVKQSEDIQRKNDRLMSDSVVMAAQMDSIRTRDAYIIEQQDSIAQTNVQLNLERDNLKKANWKMMENQSHFIAQEAKGLVDLGDTYCAIALLLEVLPDSLHPDRPRVAEAEKVLRIALDSLNKDGYVSIAILDSDNDRAGITKGVEDIKYDEKEKKIWVLFGWSDDDGGLICSFDLFSGALLYRCKEYVDDDYNAIFESLNFNLDYGVSNKKKTLIVENGAYKLEYDGSQCVLYKHSVMKDGVVYHRISIDEARFNKKSFCMHSPYMILRDSIYDYMLGKTIRSIGLPDYHNKVGVYSNDDKYILALNLIKTNNTTTKATISVEDALTGRIIQTYDYKDQDSIEIANMSLEDLLLIDNYLCVCSCYDWSDYYRLFSIPNLKQVYKGTHLPDDLYRERYYFDYDTESNLVYLKEKRSKSVVKTMNIDLRHVNDTPQGDVGFELLDNNHKLFIYGMAGSAILYDLKEGTVIRRFQFQPDRYGGFRFDSNKMNMLSFTHNNVTIYDAIYGEQLLEFDPYALVQDSLWALSFDIVGDYGCSFTKDESHIIYILENEKYFGEEDNDGEGDYTLFVIPWKKYDKIIDEAKGAINGRKLSEDEKRKFYLN